ncbi:MAG: hypothetical protein J0H17_09310 [Rhizobiales bacterium]|nr:hypothetical protein [Hyphomicrobiales bacterium]
MYFARAAYLKAKPMVIEALVRALAKATKLMNNDTATARDAFFAHDAFFAQMTAKSFGVKTDPKLAQLQWDDMRPYFPATMAISESAMARAWTFFHIPNSLKDKALIDNTVALRVDQSSK